MEYVCTQRMDGTDGRTDRRFAVFEEPRCGGAQGGQRVRGIWSRLIQDQLGLA